MNKYVEEIVVFIMLMLIGYVIYNIFLMRSMDCNEIVERYPMMTAKELPAKCIINAE